MDNVNRKIVTTNMFWRFLERCGAQFVTFVVSIVLARLLDPVVYGIVALVTVVTTFLQVFVDSGLGTALIQKKDSDDLDFSTVFFFNLAMCFSLYLLIFFLAPLFSHFYNNSQLTPLLRVLGVVLIISGVKNIQSAYVSKHFLFRKFFWATLIGTIVASVVGISLAYYLPNDKKVWAIIIQNVVNQTIDTIVLWIIVKWRPKLLFSWKRLKSLFSFGSKMLLSALLDTGYNELRSLVIGKRYTSEDLGYYNRGGQFPKFIVQNINTSIDSVLLPTMSLEQENKHRVKQITRRAITTSTYVIFPCMVGLAVVAPSLVHVLLTDKWMPCVLFLQLACISYAFWPVHTANLNAIKAMGRSDLFLILEIIKKGIGIVLLIGAMFISVEAIAWSGLIATIISFVINSWPNRKLLNYSLVEQIKDMMPSLIISCIMGVIVYFIGFFNGNSIRTLFMQVFYGVSIYFVGSSMFKLEPYLYILDTAKSFLGKKGDAIK